MGKPGTIKDVPQAKTRAIRISTVQAEKLKIGVPKPSGFDNQFNPDKRKHTLSSIDVTRYTYGH
jgi:hypothetical protein